MIHKLFLPENAGPTKWKEELAQGDRFHFFHTDHLGSVRVVTDRDGKVYERTDYLPFGEIFRDDVAYGLDTPDERHTHKYTGQQWDHLSGLYYYGARYYDPEMGRFAQADTVVPRRSSKPSIRSKNRMRSPGSRGSCSRCSSTAIPMYRSCRMTGKTTSSVWPESTRVEATLRQSSPW